MEESEDTESPSSSTSSATPAHQKLHVEFKEPTVIEEAISENHQAIIKVLLDFGTNFIHLQFKKNYTHSKVGC